MTFFLPQQVAAITGQKLGFQAALVTAIPWCVGLASVAYFPGLADRTRKHHLIGVSLMIVCGIGIAMSNIFSVTPVVAILGLCLAAAGFVGMQPIFWTLPTEYMTGFAAAAGIGLVNSLGNLGGFLAPNMRNYFDAQFGKGNGLYSLAAGAFLAALLFGLTSSSRRPTRSRPVTWIRWTRSRWCCTDTRPGDRERGGIRVALVLRGATNRGRGTAIRSRDRARSSSTSSRRESAGPTSTATPARPGAARPVRSWVTRRSAGWRAGARCHRVRSRRAGHGQPGAVLRRVRGCRLGQRAMLQPQRHLA